MKELGAASHGDMVWAFVDAEFRWLPAWKELRRRLGDDDELQQIARALLACHRGYPDRLIFTNLPLADMTWRWVELTRAEFGDVHFCGSGNWVKFAPGQRRVVDGIPTYKARTSTDSDVQDIISKVDGIRPGVAARATFAPLVLLQEPDGPMTILEGNHRVVAFYLDGGDVVKLIVGSTKSLRDWPFRAPLTVESKA